MFEGVKLEMTRSGGIPKSTEIILLLLLLLYPTGALVVMKFVALCQIDME